MLEEAVTRTAWTNLAPIPMECDAPYLKVVGELPRELNGTRRSLRTRPSFRGIAAR